MDPFIGGPIVMAPRGIASASGEHWALLRWDLPLPQDYAAGSYGT